MFYEKLAVAISAFALAAGVVNAAHRNWTSEAHEPVHHIFTNASDRTLDVDDVNGTVEVTGDSGNTIRVDGEKDHARRGCAGAGSRQKRSDARY